MSNYRPAPFFDTLEQACELFRQCQADSSKKVLKPWLKQCLRETTQTLPEFFSEVVALIFNLGRHLMASSSEANQSIVQLFHDVCLPISHMTFQSA